MFYDKQQKGWRCFVSYIACDDHAAKLVYDEDIKLGRGLTKLLLQDLKDGLHHSGGVSQRHSNVTQSPDGVVWDQVSIPSQERGKYLYTHS